GPATDARHHTEDRDGRTGLDQALLAQVGLVARTLEGPPTLVDAVRSEVRPADVAGARQFRLHAGGLVILRHGPLVSARRLLGRGCTQHSQTRAKATVKGPGNT